MSCFHTFDVPLKDAKDLLIWWSKHEKKFLTIAYFEKTILTMLASRIEMKRVFFIARIFTCLCWCWLGEMNLDILVLLIKNWLKDLSIGVKGKGAYKDVDAFEEAKENIL